MSKSVKITISAIGIITIVIGILQYFKKGDLSESYFPLFIGISLIGTVFAIRDKNNYN